MKKKREMHFNVVRHCYIHSYFFTFLSLLSCLYIYINNINTLPRNFRHSSFASRETCVFSFTFPRMSIFEKMLSGKPFSTAPANFAAAQEVVDRCFRLLHGVNSSTSLAATRERFSELIQQPIDESVTIFPPIQTNFGKHIFFGKNIIVNHGCSFLDMGGIYIGDNVLIAPKVNLLTEGHPIDPAIRHTTLCPGKIVIKENAWIGAASTVLPGVTIGKNSIVAAGSVVTKDVEDNTIVAGTPAKMIKRIPETPAKL